VFHLGRPMLAKVVHRPLIGDPRPHNTARAQSHGDAVETRTEIGCRRRGGGG
jgi:hypothetical protein